LLIAFFDNLNLVNAGFFILILFVVESFFIFITFFVLFHSLFTKTFYP
jgi:hypothetical protein